MSSQHHQRGGGDSGKRQHQQHQTHLYQQQMQSQNHLNPNNRPEGNGGSAQYPHHDGRCPAGDYGGAGYGRQAGGGDSRFGYLRGNSANLCEPPPGEMSAWQGREGGLPEAMSGGGRGNEDCGEAKRQHQRLTDTQILRCQEKFIEWGGSLKGRAKECEQFAQEVGLRVQQVEGRFHYLRRLQYGPKRRPSDPMGQQALSPPPPPHGHYMGESVGGEYVSYPWMAMGAQQHHLSAAAAAAVAAAQAAFSTPQTSSLMLRGASVPPIPPIDGSQMPRRRWMTERQAEACKRKYYEWDGSLRGRQVDVAELASSIDLTPLQVEKRFHYLRKQEKLESQGHVPKRRKPSHDSILSQSHNMKRVAHQQRFELQRTLVNLAGELRTSDGGIVWAMVSPRDEAALQDGRMYEYGELPSHVIPRRTQLGGRDPSMPVVSSLGPADDVDVAYVTIDADGEVTIVAAFCVEQALYVDRGFPCLSSMMLAQAEAVQRGQPPPPPFESYLVVPRDCMEQVRAMSRMPWVTALLQMGSVRGVRLLTEDIVTQLFGNFEGTVKTCEAITAHSIMFSNLSAAVALAVDQQNEYQQRQAREQYVDHSSHHSRASSSGSADAALSSGGGDI